MDYESLVDDAISSRERVILDVGCGSKKCRSDSIGIDIVDYPCVDLVGDVFDVLNCFPDSSVDFIHSSHFCEHLEDLSRFMRVACRIMKGQGELQIIVPHFSNPFFYSDPTHKIYFGLYTMSYYCESKLFKREVPEYSRLAELELTDVELVFRSYRPRYIAHASRKILQSIFNSSNWMKEIYEDSFSNFISCYEMKFRIIKHERQNCRS